MLTDDLPIQWPARLRPGQLSGLAFQTPYLAGDVTVIAERLVEFRTALPGIEPYYAVKANPAPEVISTLDGLGIGFLAGSFSELKLLMDSGVEGTRVLLGNPVKTVPHLRAAAAAGVWRMAFDSASELRRIAVGAPGACVYLRLEIDPDPARPSGAPPGQARELMTLARDLGLVPYGLAFHLGAQQSTPAAWRPALGVLGQVMSGLLEDGIGLAMVDLGGGFPARYAGPPGTDVPGADGGVDPIGRFGTAIRAAVDELLPYRPENLVCEPGRHLVAESCVLVTTVLDRSPRGDTEWLTLDAGVHQGLAEGHRFPVTTSLAGAGRAPVTRFGLAGPTCDPADVIARDIALPDPISPGDLVMFGTAGAYTTGRTGVGGYNGFDQPKLLFV